MYTKVQFGKDLKERIEAKQSIPEIGHWAFCVFIDYEVEGFDILLIRLMTIELDLEFYQSYEELNRIADDLILDKDVE